MQTTPLTKAGCVFALAVTLLCAACDRTDNDARPPPPPPLPALPLLPPPLLPLPPPTAPLLVVSVRKSMRTLRECAGRLPK